MGDEGGFVCLKRLWCWGGRDHCDVCWMFALQKVNRKCQLILDAAIRTAGSRHPTTHSLTHLPTYPPTPGLRDAHQPLHLLQLVLVQRVSQHAARR